MLRENSTLVDVKTHIQDAVDKDQANILSALNAFVQRCDLRWEDPATKLLDTELITTYVNSYAESTRKSARSRVDKSARLVREIQKDPPSVVLSAAIGRAGLSVPDVAAQAAISNRTLNHWLTGRTRPSVALLDPFIHLCNLLNVNEYALLKFISLDSTQISGYIASLGIHLSESVEVKGYQIDFACAAILDDFRAFADASVKARTETIRTALARGTTTWREHVELRNHEPKTEYYHRTPEWMDGLTNEFEAYTKFRSDEALGPGLERHSRLEGDATLGMHESFVASYIGFCLCDDKDSPNLEPPEATIAAYLSTESFAAFRTWYVKRGNAPHGLLGHIAFAKSLLHPQTGFLTQHPDLKEQFKGLPSLRIHRSVEEADRDETRKSQSLEDFFKHNKWRRACQRAHAYYTKLYKELSADRDDYIGMQPLLPLIQHEKAYPLDLILQMLRDMASYLARRFAPDSFSYSLFFRDMLLIAMASEMPLRRKHWSKLTVGHKGSANVYKVDGVYHCSIPVSNFKNAKVLSKRVNGNDYVFICTKELSRMFDEYLSTHRPRLLKNKASEALFISSRGAAFSAKSIYKIFITRSRQFIAQGAPFGHGIPGLLPFGVHAMRYIVASDCVRRDQDFVMAANLLADSLEIVMSTYAFLIPSDIAYRMQNYMSRLHKRKK